MRSPFIYTFLLLLIIGCKNPSETTDITESDETEVIDLSRYPRKLQAVFNAHGGLQKWSQQRTLTFQLGDENHTINLRNRDTKIIKENYKIGSESGKVWIAQDSSYFPAARARFYHNLMFYFYAMPFVLADDGINYSTADALTMDGKEYPGIKVSYEANVGDSPEDEYIIYYEPETYQMSWLAYTVTYSTGQKSDRFSYIKYADWNEVNGILLPTELQWYQLKDGKPTEPQGNPRVFSKIDIDKAGMDASFYAKPENGVYVD